MEDPIAKLKELGMVSDEPDAISDLPHPPRVKLPYVPKDKKEDAMIQMLKAVAVHNRAWAEKQWLIYKRNQQKAVDKPT